MQIDGQKYPHLDYTSTDFDKFLNSLTCDIFCFPTRKDEWKLYTKSLSVYFQQNMPTILSAA